MAKDEHAQGQHEGMMEAKYGPPPIDLRKIKETLDLVERLRAMGIRQQRYSLMPRLAAPSIKPVRT